MWRLLLYLIIIAASISFISCHSPNETSEPPPQTEPLNGRIVFLSPGKNDSTILYSLDSKGIKKLWSYPQELGDISLHPSGEFCCFYTNFGENGKLHWQILTYSFLDSTVNQVTNIEYGLCWEPRLNPTNKTIYFVLDQWPARPQIASVNYLGNSLRIITAPDSISHRMHSVSFDGRAVAMQARLELGSKIAVVLTNQDSGNTEKIFEHIPGDNHSQPKWEASDKIHFISDNKKLCSVNKDGSNYSEIYTAPNGIWTFDINSMGNQIAFCNSGGVYVIGSDGTALKQLTNTTVSGFPLLWSPDGESIAFRTDIDGNGWLDLIVVNVNSQKITRLNPENIHMLSADEIRAFDWKLY